MKQIMREENKKNILSKHIAVIMATSSILFSAQLYASDSNEPNNIQLKVDPKYRYLFPDTDVNALEKQGAFDLSGEVSSVVSTASKPLLGTSPGIRTIAMVDNSQGQLETCSRVSVNYQVIDIDGDWDASKTEMNALSEDKTFTYIHYKTSDKILFGFLPKNGGYDDIIWVTTEHPEISISSNKVVLEIPPTLNVDGVKISTVGMKVVYQITPWTMIGSMPFTLKYDDPVFVDDLSKGKFLEPGSDSGDMSLEYSPQWFMQDLVRGEFTFPGLSQKLLEKRSFITSLGTEIKEGNTNNCSQNNQIITVKIYPEDNPDKNILANKSDPHLSIAENLENKPKLFSSRAYLAEVNIQSLEGKTRLLTLDEYNQSPFTWHLYYPINESCLQGKWNNPDHQSNLSASCLNVYDIPVNSEENSERFGRETIDQGGVTYVKYAWLQLQDTNENALTSTTLEGSEQGALMTVSFSLDDQQ
ncbi:hypothetical protein [Thorsellia kenyensis]|uniref:Uncharacterized protein n=1 Tax=Thorsellia kenyensis TaxID=1549888 RepID=A0ABV6CB13_9GAMM